MKTVDLLTVFLLSLVCAAFAGSAIASDNLGYEQHGQKDGAAGMITGDDKSADVTLDGLDVPEGLPTVDAFDLDGWAAEAASFYLSYDFDEWAADSNGDAPSPGVSIPGPTIVTPGTYEEAPLGARREDDLEQVLLQLMEGVPTRPGPELQWKSDRTFRNGEPVDGRGSQERGNWRRPFSTLGPHDPPLRGDEFLSCACSASSDDISHMLAQTAYRSADSIVSDGLCVSATGHGSLRVNRGYEPSEDPQSVAWEGTAQERKKGWYWRKFGKEVETPAKGKQRGDDEVSPAQDAADRGGAGRAEENGVSKEESSTEMMVHRGRVSVTRKTPQTRKRLSGFFYNGEHPRTETTFRSPRPTGYWRTYFSMVDSTGRDIRNAELGVTPDGRVAVTTPRGRVLWEPSLDV